jgi:hypothetical protein
MTEETSSNAITPQKFLAEVVHPNVVDALSNPGNVRAATNAILALDALVGIAFWYLKDRDHSSVRSMKRDEKLRDVLAAESENYRTLRDAAFSLKHGRLISSNRIVEDTAQFSTGSNMLGHFQVGDSLGGYLVYLKLSSGALVATRTIIGAAFAFLKDFVSDLPIDSASTV